MDDKHRNISQALEALACRDHLADFNIHNSGSLGITLKDKTYLQLEIDELNDSLLIYARVLTNATTSGLDNTVFTKLLTSNISAYPSYFALTSDHHTLYLADRIDADAITIELLESRLASIIDRQKSILRELKQHQPTQELHQPTREQDLSSSRDHLKFIAI